jgi:hypothetical protein
MQTATPRPRARRDRRARSAERRRRAIGIVLGALALGWAVLLLWANAPDNRSRIRARAEDELRRRLVRVEVGEAHVDWMGRAVLSPIVVPASRGDRPPLLRVERVLVRPSVASLLAGRLAVATVTLEGVRLAPGPGAEELRRLLDRPQGRAGTGTAPSRGAPALFVRDLVVILERRAGDAPLEIGPFGAELEASPDGSASRLRGRLLLPGGGRVAGELRRGESAAILRADIAATLPGDLPRALAAALPLRFPSGRIEGEVEARAPVEAGGWTARFRLGARGVSMGGPPLGALDVGPLEAHAVGEVRWDAATRRAELAQSRLALGTSGRASAGLQATLSLGEPSRLSFEVVADRVEWGELLAALPPALQPPERAPRVSGPVSARLRAEGPLDRSAPWKAEAELDLEGLRRAAQAAGPSWLSQPFLWRPVDPSPDEPPREIAVGPSSPFFVPLTELPAHLVRAVTTSEDAGFFAHRGFDFQEIAQALAADGGARLRGASTITQQVAKNLFLSSERTLSRKVREALATVALEAAVPKPRLLEIYLNLAEWGPGVYGVGEAALFWLGKDARQLTPKESAFLASVIPSPRRFHERLLRGGVSGWWADRISDILSKMWIQGQLGDEQLLQALDEPLALAPGPAHPSGPEDASVEDAAVEDASAEEAPSEAAPGGDASGENDAPKPGLEPAGAPPAAHPGGPPGELPPR